MIRIKPRKVLTFGAATATLLVLGGCWNCPTCPPEKDIEYAWDIPESQATKDLLKNRINTRLTDVAMCMRYVTTPDWRPVELVKMVDGKLYDL